MTERSNSALWTHQEVDALTGGKSTSPWQAIDLTIRADDVCPGDLFFASPEDDLFQVFEDGAAAAVVSRDMRIPLEILSNYPIVQVPCAYEALRILARAARARTHSVVIAVQGFEQRQNFSRALGAVSDYYEGGRHLSSAMAAMPIDCDFSVFSLSPSLSPDIAVIDKPSALRAGGLFENMPARGVVLLNGNDPAYLDVLASARAAGLTNILTYGDCDAFESYISDQIVADNGVQMACCVLGQQATLQLSLAGGAIMPQPNMLLAALCVSVLSDIKLKEAAWAATHVYPRMPKLSGEQNNALRPAKNVSLLGAPSMVEEAIFRVRNMIDTGFGRKRLVLDHGAPQAKAQDFTMPTRLGDLDVVCASKKVSIFKNARKAVESFLAGAKLQHIVPDVLTPGDYVVFKSSMDAPHAEFVESLRVHS